MAASQRSSSSCCSLCFSRRLRFWLLLPGDVARSLSHLLCLTLAHLGSLWTFHCSSKLWGFQRLYMSLEVCLKPTRIDGEQGWTALPCCCWLSRAPGSFTKVSLLMWENIGQARFTCALNSLFTVAKQQQVVKSQCWTCKLHLKWPYLFYFWCFTWYLPEQNVLV